MTPPPASAFEPWRGVFETVRVVAGRAQFLAAHAAELERACTALGLACGFDAVRAASALPPAAEGRWRWIARPDGVTHFFTAEPIAAPTARYPLQLAAARLGSENLDARHKTLSYLTHAQAAAENPTGEAALLNEHGRLASASRANLFWWSGGRLFTPAHECGCRRGVVRGWVLGHARAEEVGAGPEVLDAAEEIFVTNSMRGLQPVTHWRGRELGPNPQTTRLREALARFLAE